MKRGDSVEVLLPVLELWGDRKMMLRGNPLSGNRD
jgi:hypothetical protein